MLQAIHQANAMEMEGRKWGFPEYVNGKTLRPGGASRMGWSAAGAIIGHWGVQGKAVLQGAASD
jgi:hypothetical protein